MIAVSHHRRSGGLSLAFWGFVAPACVVLFCWGGYKSFRYLEARSCAKSAREAMDRHDFPRAVAWYKACTEYWPDDPELHFLAAQAYRRAMLWEADQSEWESEAELKLNEAERLNYVREAITTERALLALADGELARVESYLLGQVALGSPDKTLILEGLVSAYLEAFRLPWALFSVSQLLAREPQHVQGLYWRGLTRDLLFYKEQAIEDYRQVLALKPDHDKARVRLSQLLIAAKLYAEADEILQPALERSPENPELLLSLAGCRIGQNRLSEAEQILDQVLAIQPHNVRALAARGKAALEQGHCALAEHWLHQAVELAPFDQQATSDLYQCLLRLGKKDQADGVLVKLNQLRADDRQFRDLMVEIQRKPEDPALRQKAGTLLLRRGQAVQALIWLNGALQIDPLFVEAHKALANYYSAIKQSHPAEVHRRLAVEGQSTRPR